MAEFSKSRRGIRVIEDEKPVQCQVWFFREGDVSVAERNGASLFHRETDGDFVQRRGDNCASSF